MEGEGRLVIYDALIDVIKKTRTRRYMPVARFPVLSSFVNHAFVSDTSLRLRPRLYAAITCHSALSRLRSNPVSRSLDGATPRSSAPADLWEACFM